ncbi:MAG: hypothetical protein R3E55_02210 [Burkholderiaceae bacterium]
MNLQNGRFEKTWKALESSARDAARTLVDGKPMVAELVASRSSGARMCYDAAARDDGTVLGVVRHVAAAVAGFMPVSMAVPQRADTRLVVFTREG